MELLIHKSPHCSIHDAESLIYVLLFLCSHLDGPGKIRDPLYGSSKHPSGMKQRLSSSHTFNTLGHLKFSHMGAHLDVEILPHLSPYFAMLHPHISNLWMALYPGQLLERGREASHCCTTLHDIIKVFKDVLLNEHLIGEVKKNKPVSLGKRSFPGELVVAGNGWDAVKVQKKESESKLKHIIRYKRTASLMKKHGHYLRQHTGASTISFLFHIWCIMYVMYTMSLYLDKLCFVRHVNS